MLGSMVQIEADHNRIVFENDQSINYTIPYDILVVCVGAGYKSQVWKGQDKADRMRVRIANSERVLVVGGGVTGIETAAYLAAKKVPYCAKVGLCLRGDTLLPEINGAHDRIEAYLT